MTTAPKSIQRAINAGLTFKRIEKRDKCVSVDSIAAYQEFNKKINGLSDQQKDFINSEVRRLFIALGF